jgi:hypothetical protein
VAPEPDDEDAEDRADEEAQTPAEVLREVVGVQEEAAGDGTDGGTTPVGAVDGDVDTAAVSRRDDLVDRGVDRRVLAADAGTGDEAEDVEEPRCERETGDPGADEVDDERDDEEVLPAQVVGQPSEEQGAADLPEEVERRGKAHFGRSHAEGRRESVRGDDLHLETVQDPRETEADHDHPVEPRPRQSVHPSRDERLHFLGLHLGRRHL